MMGFERTFRRRNEEALSLSLSLSLSLCLSRAAAAAAAAAAGPFWWPPWREFCFSRDTFPFLYILLLALTLLLDGE